jgi:hypothetical protein
VSFSARHRMDHLCCITAKRLLAAYSHAAVRGKKSWLGLARIISHDGGPEGLPPKSVRMLERLGLARGSGGCSRHASAQLQLPERAACETPAEPTRALKRSGRWADR